MALFTGQDYQLILASDISLATASPLNIRYEKPDGTAGEVTAIAGGVGNQSAIADITAAINDTAGNWEFQFEAVISAKTRFSTMANVKIKPVKVDPTP